MDPRSVTTASETPSHEGSGEYGGDTTETGFLSSHPREKSPGSDQIDSQRVNSMEAGIDTNREQSFYFSSQTSPKVDRCTSITDGMSAGVDPIALNVCTLPTGEAPSRQCPERAPLLERECSQEEFSAEWPSSCRNTAGEVSNKENGEDGVAIQSTLSLANDSDSGVDARDPERCAVLRTFTTESACTTNSLAEGGQYTTKTCTNTNVDPEINCQQEDTRSTTVEQEPGTVSENVKDTGETNSNDQEFQPKTQDTTISDNETDPEVDDVVFNFSGDENDALTLGDETNCSVLTFSKESFQYTDDEHGVRLIVNLREFKKQEQFCDLAIRVQNNLYRVHRCVLAANCYVLQTMIKDSNQDIIDLSALVNSSEAFECILEYLYSGEVSVSMATVSEMLSLCKKLGIPSISRCCSMHIEKNISINTWAHILDLSVNYDFPDVAQKVVRFFADNLQQLYKTKEAMYFSYSQLEQILRRSNHRHGADNELLKLDLMLHWVSSDYENRATKLPRLLHFINIGQLTKEAVEKVFRQKTLKHHAIFENETIKMFIADVRTSLITRKKAQLLAQKQRKSSQALKVSKRGRPRKIIDYSQADDSSIDVPDPDEDEYVPDMPLEPVVVLKKKRGRPPKNRDTHSSEKRPRGRPRKYVNDTHTLEGQTIKEENMECQTEDVKLPPDILVKSECGVFTDTAMKTFTGKVKRKPWNRSVQHADGHICLVCGKKFAMRKQLTRHAIIHREKTKMCDLCDYKTTRNDKVRDHIRRVHADVAVERGLLSVEEHQQRLLVEANKPRFHRHRNIKRLLETESAEEMVPCPKCPRKFTSLSLLRHHMKGHGSETPFLCEVCGFTTKHFASINVHKRQHNGKKFRCTFPGCTYENIRKSRLDDHMSAHTGIKNHVCSVCGKAFAGRKHMQRHEKTHLEIKPLKCEYCEYATTRRDKLRDHIRKHHRNIAISLGILDPDKIDESKELKPARVRRQKKKRIKCDKQQDNSLLITDTVEQLINDNTESSAGVSRQEVDQVANFVTMAVPSHLLGVTTSTINEDVIQYLASMTPNNNLPSSHSQIHQSLTLPVTPPQSGQNTQSIQGVPITQAPAVAIHAVQPQQQLMRTQNIQQVPADRGDTWIYHIIPESQHQYS